MKRFISLLLGGLLLVFGAAPALAHQSVRLQDDFYEAVNERWLQAAELPGDMPAISGFWELSRQVSAQLQADFNEMNRQDTTGPLGQFLAYYDMASDYQTRDAVGGAPLAAYIERIQALTSLAELDEHLADWVRDCMPLPISLHVSPDMGNAQQHAVYISDPGLFLPDASYYSAPLGQELLQVFMDTGQALLTLAGVPNPTAVMTDALAFDALLVPYAKTAAEAGAYPQMYNPMDMDAFSSLGGVICFDRLLQNLLGQRPAEVVVMNPRYIAAFSKLVTEETFPQLQHWMLVNTVFHLAGYLDQAFLHTVSAYQRALTGQTQSTNPAELAFLLATGTFGGVVGDYYGRTYFGEDARQDVLALTDTLIDTFKARLTRNDWLSSETIQAAMQKLDTLVVNIGYPDEMDPMYHQFQVVSAQEGGTLLDNTMAFAQIARAENFAQYSNPVNRHAWNMTAHTVNAQYNPVAHAITFPAALLQAPFYSPHQSAGENYGGIGTVIAHEITHAFDHNGAQFDASGSLHNWWSEADFLAFDLKTQAMIALFDGVPHGSGSLCGRMTVTENTADAGGLGCALEALQVLPASDLEAFFYNWATIWRNIATPAYTDLLLALDVHAPGKVRANLQLGNLDIFYEIFGVTEEDGMYIPTERRVVIW
ncbi:MAG: M13 family metallopeptidase [Oscillospiraceae bacterium]|nr:M13 family metallopeptidase [Oscillospiraceae bacterium]